MFGSSHPETHPERLQTLLVNKPYCVVRLVLYQLSSSTVSLTVL